MAPGDCQKMSADLLREITSTNRYGIPGREWTINRIVNARAWRIAGQLLTKL